MAIKRWYRAKIKMTRTARVGKNIWKKGTIHTYKRKASSSQASYARRKKFKGFKMLSIKPIKKARKRRINGRGVRKSLRYSKKVAKSIYR